MKIVKLAVAAALIFISTFTFQSCTDDTAPVTAVTTNVAGRITGLFNQYVPSKTIKIGNQFTQTASDGSFRLSNITVPYSLLIVDSTSLMLYKNLTTSEIRISDYTVGNEALSSEVTVTLPQDIFQTGVSGKLMITDGNYINAYGDISSPPYPFKVYLPDNELVNLQVIVLTYKKDAYGNIMSYENYGESPYILVTPGQDIDYTFHADQLTRNPGEAVITGNFSTPSDYTTELPYFTLTFADKLTRSYLHIVQFQFLPAGNFNFMVPTGLPREYTILAGNAIHKISNTSLQTIQNFEIPMNSSGINLQSNLPASLVNPPENASGVNLNTQFSFSDERGNGVYAVSITNNSLGGSYNYTTTNTSFTLAELEELPFDLTQSAYYSWTVEKIGIASSVNDYLTNYANNPASYRSNSEVRHFTTGQ